MSESNPKLIEDLQRQLPEALNKYELAVKVSKQLAKRKYDGFAGTLPNWIPDPLKREFKATRTNLLNNDIPNYDYQGILRNLIDIELGDKNSTYSPCYPKEYHHELHSLIYIKNIVALGKEKGLEAYLGKGGHKIYREIVHRDFQRAAGRRPRADPLKEILEGILKDNPNDSFKDVLNKFEKMAEYREGTIETVKNGVIEWTDKKWNIDTKKWDMNIKKTSSHALKMRIHRIKNKNNL